MIYICFDLNYVSTLLYQCLCLAYTWDVASSWYHKQYENKDRGTCCFSNMCRYVCVCVCMGGCVCVCVCCGCLCEWVSVVRQGRVVRLAFSAKSAVRHETTLLVGMGPRGSLSHRTFLIACFKAFHTKIHIMRPFLQKVSDWLSLDGNVSLWKL